MKYLLIVFWITNWDTITLRDGWYPIEFDSKERCEIAAVKLDNYIKEIDLINKLNDFKGTIVKCELQ